METWLKRLIVSTALIVGCLIGLSTSVNAQASRTFPSRTITYRITSSSPYYKSVWTKAIKRWNHLRVVKLVKADANAGMPDVQMTTTPGDKGSSYMLILDEGDDDAPSQRTTYKIQLYRKFMKSWYFDKGDRVQLATRTIGDVMGLKTSSDPNKFDSVMNTTTFSSAKPTKRDKKNLQKLYKNVAY
ncbi:hypothetical protein [Levilactobacillus enshiensis]|uniref:hypothetical protein n=1 Tax=Levilactobacillus enshiensis TaxID=2590213 RepID=UPI00117B0731|nr:hypothetical protein [Levilactobacillus enshiensis]